MAATKGKGRGKTGPSKRNRMAGNGTNTRSKSNESTGRNYDYDKKYQKRKRAKEGKKLRNEVRQAGLKSGRVKLGDGKDIDHIKPVKKGGKNTKGNTRVVSASANRRRANRKSKTKRA
jgi:hypothetical protein